MTQPRPVDESGRSQEETTMPAQNIAARAREALAHARRLRAEGKNWLEAHNVLFGLGGVCAGLFPTATERTAFARTDEHQQVTQILNGLPDPPAARPPLMEEASGNLHVRLPRSLHAALRV